MIWIVRQLLPLFCVIRDSGLVLRWLETRRGPTVPFYLGEPPATPGIHAELTRSFS